MAIILEDGTGLATANALASLEFTDTYHTSRNRMDWVGEDAVKIAAIIRATDHLEKRFGHRWKGMRLVASQSLSWPRTSVSLADGTELPSDAVPMRVVAACVELARIALARAELDPIPAETGSDATGKVMRRRTVQRVGSLASETEEDFENQAQRVNLAHSYGDRPPTSLAVSEAALMEYPAAELWLDGLLLSVDTREIGNISCPVISSGAEPQSQFGENWEEQFENYGQTFGGYPTTRW